MAIVKKGFTAYFCKENAPYENIKSAGSFNISFVNMAAPILNGTYTWERMKNELQTYIPDYSSLEALACVSTLNSYYNPLYPVLAEAFPGGCPRLGVNDTGERVRLKLIAANGSYAISRYLINNGESCFTSSYTTDYNLYDSVGTQIAGALALTGGSPANAAFVGLLLWGGGDITPDVTRYDVYSVNASNAASAYIIHTSYTLTQLQCDWLNAVEPLPPEDTDPYSGLDGTGGLPSGVVPTPGLPGLTATSTGIIGLFAPNPSQMQALASYMWTDFGGQGTDVVSVLKELVEAFKRAIANPLDYVIGLNIIPSQGLTIGADKVIRFGFTSTGVSMPVLTHQYFTVDCGELSFDEVCGGTFLDYAPYSKFSIYLPYIGVKDVDANDFVGHTIGVIYHGDTVTGGITAYILKDGSVMYQYSGCCALNIPLSSDNWGNTISGAVQIATAIAAGAASGGAAGVAKAAALGASSVAANPSLLSPQVAHSGAVSGAAGCMGVQFPFVIREAVSFHSTEYFNKVTGYPSYYHRQLSDVTGYTKVLDVHLHGIPATQDEITEIESILKEGAIF